MVERDTPSIVETLETELHGIMKVRQHGASVVVTLPQAARDAVSIDLGDDVVIRSSDDALIIQQK